MDAKARIRELMQERGWSEYRLAIASGLCSSYSVVLIRAKRRIR